MWGEHKKIVSGTERETTNNRMELMAAIGGLRAIKKPCEICLTTDSTYVKNGITEWINDWRKRNWRNKDRKAIKNVDLWQSLDAEVARLQGEGVSIEWHWVKGHSGHEYNEQADALANEAIDKMLVQG